MSSIYPELQTAPMRPIDYWGIHLTQEHLIDVVCLATATPLREFQSLTLGALLRTALNDTTERIHSQSPPFSRAVLYSPTDKGWAISAGPSEIQFLQLAYQLKKAIKCSS